ncbi:cellulase N-terminal Ig-like domain-containing protein, partial [Streptomyces sp. NPDC059455]|uniref:cellulase N-terminal Ig-like domain-containing protein n=1 Tax=Streptomyces sp. NPDC059455 TaxID=3346837 RepID=UPI00369C3B79
MSLPLLRRPRGARAATALLTGALLLIAAQSAPAGADSPAAPSASAAPSAVQVNQLGYLPDGPKRATVVSASTTALPWQLRDAAGRTAASGTTTVRGADAASGQSAHLVDFSSYQGTGTGYTLTVDGRTSHPFDLRANLYDGLRADAMSFFYQQRSGIPIEASLTGADYARPAGHLGVAPNRGDTAVPCVSGVCDYTRDVRGGWYDAGDQGKYVVNGGLAVWQLVNSFERAKRTGHAAALGGGPAGGPPRGAGGPPLLESAVIIKKTHPH